MPTEEIGSNLGTSPTGSSGGSTGTGSGAGSGWAAASSGAGLIGGIISAIGTLATSKPQTRLRQLPEKPRIQAVQNALFRYYLQNLGVQRPSWTDFLTGGGEVSSPYTWTGLTPTEAAHLGFTTPAGGSVPFLPSEQLSAGGGLTADQFANLAATAWAKRQRKLGRGVWVSSGLDPAERYGRLLKREERGEARLSSPTIGPKRKAKVQKRLAHIRERKTAVRQKYA